MLIASALVASHRNPFAGRNHRRGALRSLRSIGASSRITPPQPPASAGEVSVEVSACLVVRNEEAVIRRCLASLRGVADEIILVTRRAMRGLDGRYRKRVRLQGIESGALVGNPEHHTVFAYEQARGEWLLSLDADEFLSTEMAAVIPELIRRDDYAAW